MANLNKVMLIGRLTRDPEMRTFANGGKVAKFGFAVNNRKKNQQTGQWEDEPVFLDVEAFNRETGRKLADLVEQYSARRGTRCSSKGTEARPVERQETARSGQKLKIVLDDFQFLEPQGRRRQRRGRRRGDARRVRRAGAAAGGTARGNGAAPTATTTSPNRWTRRQARGGQEEDIPF